MLQREEVSAKVPFIQEMKCMLLFIENVASKTKSRSKLIKNETSCFLL